MQKSLLAIQRRTGCGILFITHSIDEALVLADQILILGNEKIIKRYLLTAKTAQTNDTGKSLSDLKADILMNI
jgi:ABC-type nitrate/sulfonate/bicarbonate transport system ATPase subunit